MKIEERIDKILDAMEEENEKAWNTQRYWNPENYIKLLGMRTKLELSKTDSDKYSIVRNDVLTCLQNQTVVFSDQSDMKKMADQKEACRRCRINDRCNHNWMSKLSELDDYVKTRWWCKESPEI